MVGLRFVFFFLLHASLPKLYYIVKCCVEENGLLGLWFWILELLQSYMYVKDYVTRVTGWELHDTDNFKFCYLGDISAFCLMQVVFSSHSGSSKCSCTKGSCFRIACSLHELWSQAGARCLGRLRSLTLEKWGPKRLRSQVRGSLALMLSEALDVMLSGCIQLLK